MTGLMDDESKSTFACSIRRSSLQTVAADNAGAAKNDMAQATFASLFNFTLQAKLCLAYSPFSCGSTSVQGQRSTVQM